MRNLSTEIETRSPGNATRDRLHAVSAGHEGPDVVAVIPAYNEERFIAGVVMLAQGYADHVIVVDDGSTDKTALLAALGGAEVLQMPENGGKGRALNAGFRRARELRPRAVVMLDGDAQHSPEDIPQVVRPILEGEADVVIGSRFLETRSDIPGWRQVGQHALTAATNRASGLATTDSQSGFRAFSMKALAEMHFESNGLAVESEMQFLLERSSLTVAEAPISVSYLDGNKRNPVVHGLQVADAILSLVARRRPLLSFGLTGAVALVLGIWSGLTVVQTVDIYHVVPLGTVMLCALLLMVGLMLAVTGIILNTLEHFLGTIRKEMHRTFERLAVTNDVA